MPACEEAVLAIQLQLENADTIFLSPFITKKLAFRIAFQNNCAARTGFGPSSQATITFCRFSGLRMPASFHTGNFGMKEAHYVNFGSELCEGGLQMV